MMKTIKIFLTATLLIGLLSTSCQTVVRPYLVTDNPMGKKKGTSSTKVILGNGGQISYTNYSSVGIRFHKDYGIAEAAKKGKISRIAAVDLQYTNYFLFGKYTLIVYGD